MRVLLVGKGGREHALAWKLSQTAERVYVVPGNGGTAQMGPKVINVDIVEMTDFPGLVALAQHFDVDLVVPSPDDIVVDGIADVFTEGRSSSGIPCFAPSKAAAKLEGSKAFAKDFMKFYNIPTADYRKFSSYPKARDYLSRVDHRVVIKVSGPAAGKGVVLPESQEEALRELREIMVGQKFGSVGSSVVIEEFLEGDEISILTFSDGHTFKSLPPGQDHKRIFDGNKGPNTGGMGVCGPTDFVSTELLTEIDEKILAPTLQGLRDSGCPFRGMLFTGIMLTARGPRVLEYNVRFGDPETQSLIPLMSQDSDLARICLSCTMGTLADQALSVRPGYACNVVISAPGYPGQYEQGGKITISRCPEGDDGLFLSRNGIPTCLQLM
ncbi:hypothetical protein ACHAQA_000503 [Verticillium albo-atrum]